MVYLDLAFGSVPHSLSWKALRFLKIPDSITRLVSAYFSDIQFCRWLYNFIEQLEFGIMAGCTILALAIPLAMEVIIMTSKWVFCDKKLQHRTHLPAIRVFMDAMADESHYSYCSLYPSSVG